jgi:hypothetical protein
MDDGGGLLVSKVVEDLTLRYNLLRVGGGERADVLSLLDRRTDDGNAVDEGGSLARKSWWKESATLVALGRDKTEASESTPRTMCPLRCAETYPNRRSNSAMV